MNKDIKKIYYCAYILIIFLMTSCSVKKYALPDDIEKGAEIFIDGSESYNGVNYKTTLNINLLDPATCMITQQFGEIKVKRNKNSEKFSLPSGKIIYIYLNRVFTSTSVIRSRSHHSYFIPKLGSTYAYRVFDKNRKLFDLSVYETDGEIKKQLNYYTRKNVTELCLKQNMKKGLNKNNE